MCPVSTSGETPLSLPHRCAAWRRQPRAAAGPWGTPPATSCSGRHRPVTNAPRGFCCRGHAPPRFAQRPPARLLRVFSASVSPPLVQVASGQRPVRRRNHDRQASHVGHTLRRVHGHDLSRFWRALLLPFFAFALTVSVLPLSHTCSSSLDPHSQAPAGLRTDVTSPVRTTYGRFVATVGPRLSRPRPGRTAPRSRAPLAATMLLRSAPLPALCCTQQRLSAPAGSHARLALPRPAPPPFPGGRARARPTAQAHCGRLCGCKLHAWRVLTAKPRGGM